MAAPQNRGDERAGVGRRERCAGGPASAGTKKPAGPQAGRAARPKQGELETRAVYSFPVGMKSSSSSISPIVSIATPLGVSSQLST